MPEKCYAAANESLDVEPQLGVTPKVLQGNGGGLRQGRLSSLDKVLEPRGQVRMERQEGDRLDAESGPA